MRLKAIRLEDTKVPSGTRIMNNWWAIEPTRQLLPMTQTGELIKSSSKSIVAMMIEDIFGTETNIVPIKLPIAYLPRNTFN